MSDWGRSTYGQPCRECGFDWGVELDDAIALVRAAPERYARLITDGAGSHRIEGLAWSSVAYVCHVGDNLRIWSERLVGATAAAPTRVEPYDADLLARARNYGSVALAAARWSLSNAANAWTAAVRAALEDGVVLVHPDRGSLSAADVVRSNAHDTFHHEWDVARIEAAQ